MQAALPHCRTCLCVAAPPHAFVSDVRLLPSDPGREYTYRLRRGGERVAKAMWGVGWDPVKHSAMQSRVHAYWAMLELGSARNVREAVQMLALARREWLAEETRAHGERLRKRHEGRVRMGEQRYLLRKKQIVRDAGGPCAYCGDPRTVDHIIPMSQGGDHRLKNLTLACAPCNSQKGNRTPSEWKAARLAAGLPWPPLPRASRKAS